MTRQLSLSIVIPHYSNTALLQRLLSTIPSIKGLKVIVVDDFSPVQYQSELDKLEFLFPNVLFIRLKKNGRAGYARNSGLKAVDSDYVLFADCDDFFLPSFEWVVSKYLTSETIHDVVYFNAVSMDSETYGLAHRANHLNGFFNEELDKCLFLLKYSFGEPWCKMIRTSLLKENNIVFDEISIHEDTKFSYLVGFYSKDVIAEKATIYCITDRDNSVSKGVGIDKLETRIEVFGEKEQFLKSHGIALEEQFLTSTIMDVIRLKDKNMYKHFYTLYKKYDISILYLIYSVFKNKFISLIKKDIV